MQALFKNNEYQKKLEQEGFVVLPFFDEEEINALFDIYAELPKKMEYPFESSSFIDDDIIKQKADETTKEVFQSKIDATFTKHKFLGTSFLTKRTGAHSEMPIHQDWTVVDESKYASITCWVPLQDTNIKNGAIQVILGSHTFFNDLRSPTIPIVFDEIYEDLKPYLKTLVLKKGEAFIFNQALMHSSLPNLSSKNRIAVTYGLTHRDAQLFMYYANEKNIEKWQMPDNMFLQYPKIREKPLIGNKIEEINHKTRKISINDFRKKVLNYRKNNKMKPLFKDEVHQSFFEQNGFIKLPALQEDDISKLKELYKDLNLKDEKGYGFHVGMDNTDKTLVKKMVDEIKSIALPKVQPYLYETQLFTASFVVKEPNPQGVVPPHQDWSFVENEEDHCSVTCWIPLQDVNIDNGCLGVIKGSNHFFDSVRPSPSPQVGTPLKEHMFTIFPFLELIEMKAGEALIFNNKTIHASPPNITDTPRLAVGLGFTQKEAEIRHYYLKPGTEKTLLKYKIDPEFFFKYDNAQLSEMYNNGNTIQNYGDPEEVQYDFDDLDAETFTKLMQESGASYNAPLVARMAKLFNYNTDGTKKEEQEVVEEALTSETKQKETEKRTFWEVYTPVNIAREIKYRITGK